MGLFDKKTCSVCGGQIGLLGNRKLDDGNLCKDCAAKLSPFFTGRRRSTVADIKAQLAYREENRAKLSSFRPTLSIDGAKKIFIAEPDRKFIISNSASWMNANPDIFDYSMITKMDIEVEEEKTELTEEKDGKEVPFDPPQFEYEYTFKVCINVNHPFVEEIKFDLNNETIDSVESALYRKYEEMAKLFKKTLTGDDTLTMTQVTYSPEEAPVDIEILPEGSWKCECGVVNTGKFCTQCGKPQPSSLAAAKFCPECGHELNGAKFCPECGTKIG